MPTPPKDPIERISVKTKWQDVFVLDIKASSSEILELRDKTKAALDYIQSHKFTDPATGAVVSGQELMQKAASYLQTINSDPTRLSYVTAADGIQGGKFVIQLHDREATNGPYNRSGIFSVGSVKTGAPAPAIMYIGLDYQKKAQMHGTDGKLHPVTLEGVLVNSLAQYAAAKDNYNLGLIQENTVLAAFGEPKHDVNKAADMNHPHGKIQTLYNSKAGLKYALVDPAQFPTLPSGDHDLSMPTGGKPVTSKITR